MTMSDAGLSGVHPRVVKSCSLDVSMWQFSTFRMYGTPPDADSMRPRGPTNAALATLDTVSLFDSIEERYSTSGVDT